MAIAITLHIDWQHIVSMIIAQAHREGLEVERLAYIDKHGLNEMLQRQIRVHGFKNNRQLWGCGDNVVQHIRKEFS